MKTVIKPAATWCAANTHANMAGPISVPNLAIDSLTVGKDQGQVSTAINKLVEIGLVSKKNITLMAL